MCFVLFYTWICYIIIVMKTMKNFLSILIMLSALLLVFTGCQSTPKTEIKTEETTVPSENIVPVEPEKTIPEEDEIVDSKFDLQAATAESLTGGWTLYTMEDKNGEYPISCNVTMSFNFGEETEIFGLAGINNYHGIVSIDGLDITFGPIAVTKMAGLPEDMVTEDNFLRILSDVNQIGFSNNAEGYEELILTNGKSGSVLCFIR